MSVQHQKIVSSTLRAGPAHYRKVYCDLPGIIVSTANNDGPDVDVNRLITNEKTPGAGNQDKVKKLPGLPHLPAKAPKTVPRSYGQIPYAGKMY